MLTVADPSRSKSPLADGSALKTDHHRV